jgi:ectoine hydroxylase-related dioxygenase (phytanoyl-CoA dioxygenase family)
MFRLRNTNNETIGHQRFLFGPSGGIAIAGDWTGKGSDGLGVYDPSRGMFFLRDVPESGESDHYVTFGGSDSDLLPIAGRFAPDAPPGDSVGLYSRRLGEFFLKTSLASGPAELQFQFGPAGARWFPVVGDWAGQGYDTVGLVDPETRAVYLRFDNSHGEAHAQFAILDDSLYGRDWVPLAGRFEGVCGEARPYSAILGADRHLRSALWVDQPNAAEAVEEKCQKEGLSPTLAPHLREFIEQGYTVLRQQKVGALADAVEKDIDRLWEERPNDLLVVEGGRTKGRPFSNIPPRARQQNWRIPDLHSHSDAARELYLLDVLHRFAETVFGEPAVAIQSLYFPRGSEQGMHRDPMFVLTDPPSNLMAAWIALEDITPESGPLMYLPGSHRLPYVDNGSGGVAVPIDNRSQGTFEQVAEELWFQTADYGLEETRLTCQKGDILIWHGSLFHGGAPVLDPRSTRKSFVIHYSTESNYPERVSNYETIRRSWYGRKKHEHGIARTRELIGNGFAKGVDNPLRQKLANESTISGG